MISVGIDVSKEKSTICIVKPCGEILKSPYEISHTKEELQNLVSTINTFSEETRVILEATGYYHLPILNLLNDNGIFVSVVNALVMKKYASTAIRRGKTDKIDAIKIANYGISYWHDLAKYSPKDDVYEELNLLSRQYHQYIGMRTKSKITIGNLLDKTMPGISSLLKNNSDNPQKDKLYAFAKQFWHYDNITSKSEKQFTASYLKWAKNEGYHQSESKAKTIYALAKNSIPTLNSNTSSTKMLILEAVRVHREIDKTITIILELMNELCGQLIEYPIVRAMSGIGDKLAPRIIAEIGDVRRFHSAKALVAFAGIDAPPHQSGNFNGTRCKISKRGSKYLRKTGYEIMKCLKTAKPTTDSAVYDFIIKKESEGKSKKSAKIAGLNKFLHIYYARVKQVYEFDGYELTEQDIYEQNRKNAVGQ